MERGILRELADRAQPHHAMRRLRRRRERIGLDLDGPELEGANGRRAVAEDLRQRGDVGAVTTIAGSAR